MATCAVCKDASTATKANKMLLERASVRDVAAATSISKSAIDRHKRNCLTKAQVYEDAPSTVEQPKLPAKVSESKPQGKRFTPPEPVFEIATPQDYDSYQQWLLDRITQAVTRAEETENIRLLLTATKEGRDQSNSIAKRKGWIQDAAQNDNRQVNIFQGLSVEAMTSLRDSLRQALQPAPLTIDAEAVEIST